MESPFLFVAFISSVPSLASFSCPPSKVARTSNTTASSAQTWNAGQDMSCSGPSFQSLSLVNLDKEPHSNYMSKEWRAEAMSQELFSNCEPIRLKSKQSPVLLRKLDSMDLGQAKQS